MKLALCAVLCLALPAAAQVTTDAQPVNPAETGQSPEAGTGVDPVSTVPADVPDPETAILAAAAAGITCQPGGYEVTLRHEGTVVLPEGTVVGWNVPIARAEGTHVLSRPFAPGDLVTLSAVLGSSYVTPARPCIASLPIADTTP